MVLDKIFKKIQAVAQKNKTPCYVVGGFVRDMLMDKAREKDVDFVILGSGLGFAKKFDQAMKQEGSLIEFPDFDTARYILTPSKSSPYQGEDNEQIVLEFAGARGEEYDEKSRKPRVKPATLKQDLERRDFTINAMAMSIDDYPSGRPPQGGRPPPLIKGRLIDPFGGQEDLKNKILRTPLDPDKIFSEDPLRMMRAARFAGQLGFAIDTFALQAIYRNRERLKIVSAERVQEELLKMLSTPEPSICLALLFQTHLLDLVLPEVAKLDGVEEIYGHQHKNNLSHTFKVVDNIAERSPKVMLRFAGLLHDIGKASTKKFIPRQGWTFYQHEHMGKKMVYQIGKRLRLSTDHTDYLAKMVRWHQQPISLMDKGITDSAVRRLIVNLGDELEDLLILGRSDITTGNPLKKEKRLGNYDRLEKRIAEVLEKDKLRAFQSPVRGEEIMKECGLKAGPTVGKIKDAIEEAILDGIIPNEYDKAREYLFEIKNKYLEKAQDWERVKNI
ncbi:HD domain-containing protein [Patescibacteria group bacterium]|nr:MAG: HD domain-containing protein [Patescibacteria group bacterium]